jgi:hypothetical protein
MLYAYALFHVAAWITLGERTNPPRVIKDVIPLFRQGSANHIHCVQHFVMVPGNFLDKRSKNDIPGRHLLEIHFLEERMPELINPRIDIS